MSKKRTHSNLELDSRRIIGEDTPFAVIEAYRAMYTNIMYMPFESKCKKLVMTSAYPGEGKTTVSVNLAYTIATTSPEARILLVDADMRSPRIAHLIGLHKPEAHGLSEYLAGIDESPAVTETVHPNLSLLPSGATNANTPALLSSSRMEKLVQFFDDNYDYVIIDTPPINVVTDAVFLSEHVDGYVISARADYSEVGAISAAVETLNNVDAKILGIVLCSLDTKRLKKHDRYGKYGKYDTAKYEK